MTMAFSILDLTGVAGQAKPVPGRRGCYWVRDAEELGYDGGWMRGGGPGARDGYGPHREIESFKVTIFTS